MPHHRKFLGVVLLVCLLFPAVYSNPVSAQPRRIDPGLSARLEQQLLQNGFANVIVGLQGNFLPEGILTGVSAVQTQRARIQEAQARVLDAVKLHRLPRFKSFKYIPYLALSVDAQGLDQLEKSPWVASIEEDLLFDPALAESVSLIGATPAQTGGYAGQGETIAILDTGVDKTHPFLAGKVVSEACYSTSYAPYSSTTVCPGGAEESTTVGSGVNCSVSSECDHGTHVAGIAAGKGTGAIPFSGVAPEANLISIQVFSRFSTAGMCPYGAPCVRSYQSDQLLALERVYALRDSYNIAAVNMSLGGGTYASYCDASFVDLKAAIDNLRSVGIATVISSGNDGSYTGISGPACISSAVSVGSTLDGSLGATPADAVSTFSNSASFLALLAPGQYIYSSVPAGLFATYQGTSMAAPHVAGAWAVLKSKDPVATVDEVLNALTGTGVPVLDARNGIAKPRIQVDAALNALPETIINSVHFGAGTYSVPEEGGHLDIVVSLDAPAQVPFTVDYATAGETAVAGNDFTPAAGTLSFSVGETSRSFSVDVLEDGADEPGETFRVELSNPSNNLIINTPGTARVTILDNEGFSDSGVVLPGGYHYSSAWGDYDHDGDLDVALSYGVLSPSGARLYRNDGGVFTSLNIGLPNMDYTYFDWVDYDNDGDLDLFYSGRIYSTSSFPYDKYYTRLYRNDTGVFTEINTGLPADGAEASYWADFDNDGDLDLLLMSMNGIRLFRNSSGSFSQVTTATFPYFSSTTAAWGDYDNDGDPDLLVSAYSPTAYSLVSKLFRNNGDGTFSDMNAGLMGLRDGTDEWGDYDSDGDLDILISGKDNSSPDEYHTLIYRNNGNSTFTNINVLLPGSGEEGAASDWGDYDNDGDLDLIITRTQDSGSNTPRVYRNDGGGVFTDIGASLRADGYYEGPQAWGDYDNDGDLDLMILGTGDAPDDSHIYRNEGLPKNTPPTAPTNPTAVVSDSLVTLTWNPAFDSQTPQTSLTYNLRVGTYPGGENIVSPMANKTTGYRYIPAMGNVMLGTNAVLKNLVPGQTYYWAVQAVDTAYAGSPFSTEGSFAIPLPSVSLTSAEIAVSEGQSVISITAALSKASPSTISVHYATSDGTAAAGSDYSSTSGTLVFAAGETSKSFNVALIEDDSDEIDETFHLALSSPTNAVLGTPAIVDLTIQDNDDPPSVQFTAGSASAGEADPSMMVTAQLSVASGRTVTVHYSTVPGTAAPGSDYTASAGLLTFSPGQTSQQITVPLLEDGLDELGEGFQIRLSDPVNASMGAQSTIDLTIDDNDPPPQIRFSGSSFSAAEDSGLVDVTVVLSAASSLPVTVDYTVDDLTGKAGVDYISAGGTLTFPAGATSQTFSVDLIDNGLDNDDKTVRLALSVPGSATLGSPSTAVLTIQDDEPMPTLELAALSDRFDEGAGTLTLTATLSEASDRTVSVDYGAAGSSAAVGDDFSGGEGTLQFDPGETTKNFTVTLVDDLLDEADEVIRVELSGPSNAALGETHTADLTIADNDPEPTVALISSTASVREGAGTVSLTVALSAASGKTVTVNYSLTPGSASAGSDYESVTGNVVFDPGETQQVVVIHVVEDAIDEPDESFTLHLDSPGNAGLGAADQVVITIQEDQPDSFSVYLPLISNSERNN